MSPRVSLSLPVYNGERFVAEAIGSILAQDYTDFELLITDNASTDGTEAICRDFARRDGRIRYLRNERNLGAAGNFNRGFELTSAEYFKWCAHDDIFSQNYLSECVDALDAAPGAVIAYGKLVEIDEEGATTGYREPPLPPLDEIPPCRRFRMLMYRQGVDAAIFGLHRRSALTASSLHRPYYSSDCTLLCELALLGALVHVPEAVLFNRDHAGRSVNMASSDRLAWQAPAVGKPTNAHEFWSRVSHLLATAYRHRDVAPFVITGPAILAWVSHPVRLSRLVLEVIGTVSPSLRLRLRAGGLSFLRQIKGQPASGGRQGT